MILILSNESIEFLFVDLVKRKLSFSYDFLKTFHRARRGPKVVAENLLKELNMQKDIHWSFCFRNIPIKKSINSTFILWVVNDVDDLRWAIENKERIGAKELWAGPNLVVVPQESEGILNCNEIDRIIVPCAWVKEVYERESRDLIGKTNIWPVGVDTKFWLPSNQGIKNKENSTILIYNKEQEDLCNKISPILNNYGKVEVIKYGEYKINEYKQALNNAAFMVWLSMSESQGLALLEALSMNVPVLAWDSSFWLYYSKELKKEFVYHNSSSSPYFSSQCGLKFKSLDEFEKILTNFKHKMDKFEFKPRDYLFENNLIIGETLRNLEISI